MKKRALKTKPVRRPRGAVSRRAALPGPGGDDVRFAEVIALIEAARTRAYQAVNTDWQLGEYISRKIASTEWGDGVVDELAASLAWRFPGVRGYTRRNLFRMRQFYDAYPVREKVSALLTQLPWTHHLIILGQAKPDEAREFYVLAAIRDRWSSRELERQIRSGAALRSTPQPKKVSAVLAQIHPGARDEFKNAYNLEFLGIGDEHSEADLHGTLLRNLGHFARNSMSSTRSSPWAETRMGGLRGRGRHSRRARARRSDRGHKEVALPQVAPKVLWAAHACADALRGR